MNWKFFISWVPGIPIAIANGILREYWFRQFLPELPSHQLSVASFIMLFGIYVWFILRWLKLNSTKEALRLGLTWFVLTVAFEFLFGHFVMGHPWATLLRDYNLLAGRLWILVLIWIGTAPVILFRIRRRRSLSGNQ
ncbi:MAG: hypothetical protein R6U58_02765 [Bacteroidales bacterium]